LNKKTARKLNNLSVRQNQKRMKKTSLWIQVTVMYALMGARWLVSVMIAPHAVYIAV